MTPEPPLLPFAPDQLTPATLSGVLAARRPGVVVEAVEVVARRRAGEGVASTADRVVLAVRYAEGADCGLPTRMVFKTTPASPRAPATMYENEVRFYGEIRDELAIEAPASFGSRFDTDGGGFGLLLEDLALRDARFPSATTPVTLAEMRSLLDHLATLHARFWQSSRFDRELSWVGTPLRRGMADVFRGMGLALVEDQVARHPFKQDLIAPLGRSVAQMWGPLWAVQADHVEPPTTLLHGDTHIGNTYLLPGERGGFLDWQLMIRGSWAHDVTYLLVTGLDTEIRRSHQESLVRGYLERLAELGVREVPSYEDAWERMRRAALWGLVIGWLICPPANYGEEITAANIRRTVSAIQDFETFAAIEALGR